MRKSLKHPNHTGIRFNNTKLKKIFKFVQLKYSRSFDIKKTKT